MRALGAIPPSDAYTEQEISDKLTYWAEHLRELNAGTVNVVLTRVEILRELDRWLDARLDLRGR